ncbi:hypothetical protein EJ02DRAFT_117727 [Clathrospora elynae]|uniref:F-box domain-containing protein n=1 Tax=Clathrospora elynae TaxID=706981 RepID=A0A6A5STB9_9PLEO|nr:hypothetical protein EJ02DRAFT_117727 [Clathrospora elynae]
MAAPSASPTSVEEGLDDFDNLPDAYIAAPLPPLRAVDLGPEASGALPQAEMIALPMLSALAGRGQDQVGDVPHSLITLADKLPLNVASHLPDLDLCNLCLVSKHLGAVAQETLYRTPAVDLWPTPSAIEQLSKTIIRRPDLARKVVRLSLCTANRKTKVYIFEVPG